MAGTSAWKRSLVFAAGSVAAVSLCAALLIESLRRVPAFYRAVDGLSAEECTTESRQFLRQSTAVFNQIENEPAWSGVFRERQVNAWLAWDFARKHAELLPHGVSQPRVKLDDGRITLGFHLQNGPVTTVVSARGRVWLPEPNYVAVELETVRAGALPIPARALVQTVSAVVQSAGLEVDWRQHAGKPVALVRLTRSGKEAAIRVDRIELRDGMLYLAGRSAVGASQRAATPSPAGPSEVSSNRQLPDNSLHR